MDKDIVYRVEDGMDREKILCTTYQMRNFYMQFRDGFFTNLDVMNYIQHLAAAHMAKKGMNVLDVCCGRSLMLPLLRYYAKDMTEPARSHKPRSFRFALGRMAKYNPFDPANGYSEEDRLALNGKCASLINQAYKNPFPGTKIRLDGADNAGIFFAKQLAHVKTKAYDKDFPELSGLKIFPQTSETDEGAAYIEYYSYAPISVGTEKANKGLQSLARPDEANLSGIAAAGSG